MIDKEKGEKRVFVCAVCGEKNTNPGAHSLKHKKGGRRFHKARAGVKSNTGKLSGYDCL